MSNWWQVKELFEPRWKEAGCKVDVMARMFSLDRKTVRRWRDRHLSNVVEVPDTDGDLSATVPKSALASEDTLLAEFGLSSDEWDIHWLKVGKHEALMGEGETEELCTVRLTLRKRTPLELFIPAREVGPYIAPKIKKRKDSTAPVTLLVVGDQQAPKHSRPMHECLKQLISWLKPDMGLSIGDLMDNETISKHKPNPEWDELFQVCVDESYTILRDYRRACETTQWDVMLGNHEDRIRNIVLERLPQFYGIRQGKAPDEDIELPELLAVETFLRLDELNMNLVKARGEYKDAQLNINDRLAARHGWLTGKDAPLNSILKVDHSMIIGHTHGTSLRSSTIYDINRNPRWKVGIENGTCCDLEGGLGYAVDPNWVNSVHVIYLWEDGTFSVNPVIYEAGSMCFGNQRFWSS